MKVKDAADITLISDNDFFLFKPNTIYIPYGADPEKLKIPLDRPTKKQNIEFIKAKATKIDAKAKKVFYGNSSVSFDYLVIATGAGMRPSEVKGLDKYALTVWTPKEMLKLKEGYTKLVENATSGKKQKVLFLVPPNNKCSGPLYESVLMLDTWLNRKKVKDNVDITWATFEHGYIQAFGPRLNEVVEKEFNHRSIRGIKEEIVKEVKSDRVIFTSGTALEYDLLVSFPPYIASTTFKSLPSDDRGFISCNRETRQVEGNPDIYVVGDAGNFPIKQAFLALLQGDAVGAHLSERILGKEPISKFTPTSMCVMEQFDKATFAQVPLHYTEDPKKPIEVNMELASKYKVGSSPIWRFGKVLLGYYLPWRYRNGKPFHAGLPWAFMDFGLKIMSALFAK